jgi:uncharacterized protein (DUF362 family)
MFVYIYMSHVVVIRFPGRASKDNITKEDYKTMLIAGFLELADSIDIKESIKKFIPIGTVGIKTNCLARKFNSTPVALAEALGDLLVAAGFDANDIIIWDRTNRELESAGYKLNASSYGVRYLGTDTAGYGYGDNFYNSGPVDSLISRIITETVQSNINMPVLKDHSIAGLSAGLKNMYGAINNPNKYHDNNCDPFAAHVSNLESIKKKNRLSIIDAVKIQYNGGPGYDSRYLSDYSGIIISDDPVAADRVGLEIVEHCRRINNHPSLEKAGRPVKYLNSAEAIGLGIAALGKIDLKVLTIDKEGRTLPGELLS